MKLPQPKRWWFAPPLPSAMLIVFVMVFVRIAVGDAWEQKIGPIHHWGVYFLMAAGIVWTGASMFPAGLFAVFIQNEAVLERHWSTMATAGYILYAGLVIAGFIWPRKSLFWILCALLVCNIAGCQMMNVEEMIQAPVLVI